MPKKSDLNHVSNSDEQPVSRHPAILRVSAFGVAGLLSVLTVTAVVPPIIADQSDRAVVNAPVTLLTSPIDGEVVSLTAKPGGDVQSGTTMARISNARLDRGTLISLEQKSSDVREKLEATRMKKKSDIAYLALLDTEIANQVSHLTTQFDSQVVELRARLAESYSLSGEKKALVDRQTSMVERNTASMDMLRPTTQSYTATLHKSDAETAKLNQKIGQLDALKKGIYVGDDLVAIGVLAQKRRDIDVDAQRMAIEERELAAVLTEHERLIAAERKRMDILAYAEVRSPIEGSILSVGAAPGRHVNAGDSVATLVDCRKRFVVAIFSYRQGQSMKVGTRVGVEGAAFGAGVVTAVLPKTSDKVDERYAVPFPQTERRELYAIIQPDDLAGVALKTNVSLAGEPTPCTVGQWVTVTKDNGIVPSMSVAWRRLETFVGSWGERMTTWGGKEIQPKTTPSATVNDRERDAGLKLLAAALHAPLTDGSRVWSSTEWKRTNEIALR